MSVTLNFPLGYEHDGEEYLWLIRARDDDDDELEVDEMCLMQSESSDRFDPFLGSLVLPTGPERVVCKIAYTKGAIEDTQREFIVYEALKHLQGKVVPRCFGYFAWPGEAGCIILEYAGEPLDTCFECVAEDVKLKILDAFVQIHDAGVKHRDVTQENVLINDDGRVSIIDFEKALKMRCKRTYSVPAPGDIGPNKKVFGCQELYDIGYALEIWKPSVIMVYGYITPLSAFNDLEALLERSPSDYSEDDAFDEMHQVLMSYVKQYWPDVYAQIPKDGQRYWPRIIMDDTPDEDLGVNSRGKTGSDPLDPLDEDDSGSASSESSGDVVVPP